MTSSSSASHHSNPESSGNSDPQTDAQSLERIKQILLGDRLDQIMKQLHDIDAHLSHRLATLEQRLEDQKAEFNQRIQEELAPLQSEIATQGQTQATLTHSVSGLQTQTNDLNQTTTQLQSTTTDLHSRLEQSNQGTQDLQIALDNQSQALKNEINSLQGQHQKLVSGLSQSFQQLAQDL